MSIAITFRALDRWPGEPTRVRRRPTFRSSFNSTRQLLDQELVKLRARDVVILADCDASEIRIDGMLRADARLRSPGVVLAFASAKGPLKFPCDTFTDWQANLRAIGLSLQALRAVDRFGVTRRSEQYTGWTALPPAASSSSSTSQGWRSVEEAAAWLRDFAKANCTARDVLVPANLQIVYRDAAKRAHPDAGGNAELMARVNSARDFIRRAIGGAS